MWSDITPFEAMGMNLLEHPELRPPLNERGEPCRWPWLPQQGDPAVGQRACDYCGALCTSGSPHPDYRDQYTESQLVTRYGRFTDEDITRLDRPGRPRYPDVTVILTGQPRSETIVIAAVLRALTAAGHAAACASFLDAVTQPGPPDLVVKTAVKWAVIW